MKRAIELIRVSTEGQAAEDRASIPAQRAINRRTATAYGLEIVKSIEISDVSGAAVLYAPEIQMLIKMIADTSIHGVVTREFSRLMRPENFSDYALLQAFADTNTVLYLPEGPIDFTSKTGRLLGTIRAAIAGMERTEILERIWGAKEEQRRAGKLGQSRIVLPFAVGYDDAKGFYYKPEAEKVREAFRRFLAGEQSYVTLSHFLGVKPRSAHLILRNPIYTGWRVIDKKRDMTPSGRYQKPNGRQADRRKIMRAPDEVIRVKVIDEPIISEADFLRVQQIMDVKQQRHWRCKDETTRRFIYNGFLTCGRCGDLVYTAISSRRREYYVCKKKKQGQECETGYMRRDRLDPQLDSLFAERLTDRCFLRDVAAEYERRMTTDGAAGKTDRLEARLISLQAQRERILDAFFEGVIDIDERTSKLSKVSSELVTTQEMLMSHRPQVKVSAALLSDLFQPFFEWEYLKREDKRRVISTLIPSIHVVDYEVIGLYVALPGYSDKATLTDMDSSPPRA